jgi:ATP phosphoribosyltransferase regulatory subunit
MKKQSLLPVGFYDLLFDEAEKSHNNINSALDVFLKAGYRLIKTPLVEFENSFLQQKSQNYFQTIDVISGESLVFRNDITPQISRLLGSRLQEEKLPLKLCYVGDVLCAKSEDLYKDRQQTQVGVEIIGCDAEKSNFEIIEILLKVLKKIMNKSQEKNLLIEFSLPNFLEIFLSEIEVKNKEELRKAIIRKNISAVKKLAGKNGEIISKIMLSNHDLKNLTKEVAAQIKSQKVSDEIKKAQKISDFLTKNFSEIKVCFDLFGDSEFSYHNGVAFDVFCGDFSYPIARGGRYKISSKDKEVDAIGATIYMNRLRKVG